MGEKIPEKVKAIYDAVQELLEEGADINRMKVSDITERAGIGKGTAYEYFDNKEELISSALLYHTKLIYDELGAGIKGKKSLSDCIFYALEAMEEKIGQRECFFRYIHIITDNGSISKTLREKMQKHGKNSYPSEDIISNIIRIGKGSGEIRRDLPETYLYFCIASKFITFAAFLAGEWDKTDCESRKMKELVCSGLIKELS